MTFTVSPGNAATDSSSRATSIGVVLPRDVPSELFRPFVERAEALGFDELWVVEDLGFRGGIAQAGVALAWTERIRVGIGILPAGARNAAFASMEIATLEQLFPGRVDAGIGHGMPSWMRAAGAWNEKPLGVLRAHTQQVSALLNGEELTSGVSLEPSALPHAAPPLLLGVRGPRSLAVSGKIADGTVLAEPVTPEYARAALEQIAAPARHRLVAYNIGVVADDRAAALEAARPALEWCGEPDIAPHITPLPFAAELAELRASSATREEFTQRLPEEWIAQLALAGTPAEVRARIDVLAAAGVHSSVFIPVGPDPVAALESLARVL